MQIVQEGIMKEEMMELFRKVRDRADECIKALEGEDEEAMETAMVKFVIALAQFESLK
jgi:malate/lactate dehydrogenase